MSVIDNIKKDFRIFFAKYAEQDKELRSLDLLSLAGVGAFGVIFLLMRIFDVSTSPANAISLVSPLLVSALVFAFRSRIADEKATGYTAKSFLMYVAVLLGLIILLPVVFWTLF